jgi:hypothetical protein
MQPRHFHPVLSTRQVAAAANEALATVETMNAVAREEMTMKKLPKLKPRAMDLGVV